jgi:hypothetical protein
VLASSGSRIQAMIVVRWELLSNDFEDGVEHHFNARLKLNTSN